MLKRKSKPKSKKKPSLALRARASKKNKSKTSPRARLRPLRTVKARGSSLTDHWVKALTTGGNVKAVAISCTSLCREICRRHGLQGNWARALSEALVGALTLAANSNKDQVLNLNIKSLNGSIKQVFVDVNWKGEIRGYLIPSAEKDNVLPLRSSNDSLGPWGEGMIQVLRAIKGSSEMPFSSTVPMITGHLAKDLTYYWVQSEQIPSAVGIQVFMDDKNREIKGAGGFLVQAMPGVSDDELKMIEDTIQRLPSYPDGYEGPYAHPKELLASIFADIAITILDDRPLNFACSCSEERVEATLQILPIEDLQALEEQSEISIRCDFCAEEYAVTANQVSEIIRQKVKTTL